MNGTKSTVVSMMSRCPTRSVSGAPTPLGPSHRSDQDRQREHDGQQPKPIVGEDERERQADRPAPDYHDRFHQVRSPFDRLLHRQAVFSVTEHHPSNTGSISSITETFPGTRATMLT